MSKSFIDFRERMETLTSDARFETWMKMYSNKTPDAETLIQTIIKEEDPLLKIWLIRFLTQISEERSVHYLLQFLQDPNSVIFDASKKALERNGYKNKWAALLDLVHSSNKTVQFYAIEKVSQASLLDGIPIFLSMLETADEPLLLELLKGLRYYVDERIFPPLNPFLNHSSEEVRFRAYIAMGSLFEGEIRESLKPFLQGLKDPSSKVRRAVLWGIRRRPTFKSLNPVFPLAAGDPDSLVRQEALIDLALFPSKKMVLFIMDLMVAEKEKVVLLKAEGILNGFPSKIISKALWKIVKHKKGKLRHKALLLLGDMKDPDRPFALYLLPQLKRAKNPKEILPLLEALGNTEDPGGVLTLESHLKGNPLLAYTAMGSLLKVWRHHPDSVPIETYLEDPKITPLYKQTILKQVLRGRKSEADLKKLRPILFKLLEHENLNIRYLAGQILAVEDSQDILKCYFEASLSEKDPTYALFLKKTVQDKLSKKPDWMGWLTQQIRGSRDKVRFLFAIAQEAKVFGNDLVRLVVSNLEEPVLLHQSEYKDILKRFMATFLFRAKLDLEFFFEKVEKIPWRSTIFLMVADVIAEYKNNELIFPIGRLERLFYEDEDETLRIAIICIMSLSGDTRALRLLTSLVCQPKMSQFEKKASQALETLVRSGS